MRWTTIGLSTGAEESLAREAMRKQTEWKKGIVSIWLPSILGLGLLTAFAYLGVRIVAARPQTASPEILKPTPAFPRRQAVAPTPSPKPVATPSAEVVQLSATSPAKFASAAAFTLITPQHGERYLQVAAVSPHMVLTYVDNLRKISMDAVVAPGPSPELMRILVGPFADRDSMQKAKAQLETAGKSPIIRTY